MTHAAQASPANERLAKIRFVNRGGKGSHRNFEDEFGNRVTVSGREGDDAKPYQERQVRENIARHKKAQE